jgi:membrane protein
LPALAREDKAIETPARETRSVLLPRGSPRRFGVAPMTAMTKDDQAKAAEFWRPHALLAHIATVGQRAFHGFFNHRCLIGASALSYSTILSFLPLTALVLVIFSNFPVFADAKTRFLSLVTNFVPELGDNATQWFQFAANNAAKTTAIGTIAFVFTSIMLLATIEDQLDAIWNVKTQRTWGQRILAYWLFLTLGPLLLGGGLSLSGYIDHFARIEGPEGILAEETIQAWVGWLTHLIPFTLDFAALGFLYCAIPNCRVRWRDGIAGALFAAFAIEVLKWAFAFYISQISTYNFIYGALAGIPIFLLWMYIFWLIVLVGAEIAAALAPRWVVESPARPGQLAIRAELAFGLLATLAENRDRGGTLSLYELAARLGTSPAIAEENLMQMKNAGLVAATSDGGWALTRRLSGLSLLDLYGALKLPQPEVLAPARPSHSTS